MNVEVMNVEQIINESINVLGSISVPVAFGDSITRPLCGVIKNLQIVQDMMKNQSKEEQEKDPDELKGVDFGGDNDGSSDKAE